VTATAGIKLTRAEAAYAHLASFQRGDKVHVGGRTTPPLSGVVTTPQQHDYADINRAHLIVTSDDGTVGVKTDKQVIEEAIANLGNPNACCFRFCPGPDARFVSMATCRVCATVQDLRHLLKRMTRKAADQ
jgi:hypothetical protein